MASVLNLRTASSSYLPVFFSDRKPFRLSASGTLRQRHACSASGRVGSGTASQQVDEALSVVNKQLECYNARDLDRFLTLLADDVHVSDGETGAIIATSKEQLRPRYVERFKSPVHAELMGRLVCGNTVVDREVITGLPEDAEADCMATYMVRDGLISRIQFVWRPRVKS